MGEIWEARQAALGGRVVAVKRIRADVLADAAPNARRQMEREFHQEALAAARLEHPGIVPIHDLGAGEDGLPLMAMKLVRGEPWDALIKRDFADGIPAADLLAKHLPILVDMAQAVAFAHSRGFIHRDLKPGQVMVGRFGETLLMDWGLAVFLPDMGEDAVATARASTNLLDPAPRERPPRIPRARPLSWRPSRPTSTASAWAPWDRYLSLGRHALLFCSRGSYPHKANTSLESMMKAMMGQVDSPETPRPRPRHFQRNCRRWP
jgi:serine/threonine protein kinase